MGGDKQSQEASLRLPGWIVGWLYATSAICTWDASFIMLRPHSFPGGSLSFIWKPYYLYIDVDGRYKDVNDPFVYGISLFNYLEVFLNVVAIILHHNCSRHAGPLAFMASVMTFWKTLFYFYAYTDLGGGAQYRADNTLLQEIFVFILPNVFWIIVPFAVIVALWSRIFPSESLGMSNQRERDSKNYVRDGFTHKKRT